MNHPGDPIAATGSSLDSRLTRAAYPRSARYRGQWMVDNAMGPNALWLTEAVTAVMDLEPGMRVLDLGCGRAISSIFLAREFGVQAWAADLWTPPGENFARIREAGAEANVFPLRCEAHDLPFAAGFFDAVVSVDAYHYFGTDDFYLPYLAEFLRPGGQIGIAVPGLAEELEDDPPEELTRFWEPAFWSFHSVDGWQRHWRRSGEVEVELADTIPGAEDDWLHWDRVCLDAWHAKNDTSWRVEATAREIEMLEADGGRNLRFVRLVGRRPGEEAPLPPKRERSPRRRNSP